MKVRLYQVDAFTDKLFKGNPAGVCILDQKISENLMQNIAMEMNLSETAFLEKNNRGYNLRWFTPEKEVDLCGHATLASAHILWKEGYEKESEIIFYTKSGMLKAIKDKDYITLDFPKNEPEPTNLPEKLSQAFYHIPFVGKNKMDYLIELEDERVLKEITPDFDLLKSIDNVRGVILTSISSDPKYDFISRFFAPNVGVKEDPVTGSSHTCLGPYWSKKLKKNILFAYQASKRGGELKIEVKEDRVYISGKAITFFKTEIDL